MTTLYGLYATGESTNAWRFTSYSKRLFRSQADAEAYTEVFMDKCCDRSYFDSAKRESLKISVIEYETDALLMQQMLDAVKCSEFDGISCNDVNGKNWFDLRRELTRKY